MYGEIESGARLKRHEKAYRKPVYRVCGLRHKDGVNHETGDDAERGKLSPRWQEKTSSGDPARGKVSMRGTGADQPVAK